MLQMAIGVDILYTIRYDEMKKRRHEEMKK